jgi:nucleoside diphosphate kinase
MTMDQAKEFYKEHAEKPFYNDLTEWMSSAPIYAMVLEKKDAVPQWRELAGPTNSEKAREIAPHR